MTDLQKRAISALLRVRMPEKGWHKQFRLFLLEKLRTEPNATLLSTQQADLWFLAWTYRRQIDDLGVVAYADQIVNGAMSLRFS